MIIVRSRVKEIAGEINIGGDFINALNNKVESLVKEALKRAEQNGRRTVMAKDV